MNPNVVVAIVSASGSVIVAVTALVLNHRGFADLRSEMNHRFGDLRSEMSNRIEDLRSDMNHRFDAVDKRFDLLEERVHKLEDRLEHPVLR
jgi:hypothetical protein